MTLNSVQTPRGFTLAELLLALAIGAAVIGAAAVGFGTLARATGRVGGPVKVTLTTAQVLNYYGLSQDYVNTNVAPNPGATLAAEDMRERFNADTLAATAVFCLARSGENAFHPATIPFDPGADTFYPETPDDFRRHLVAKGLVGATAFTAARNYSITVPNASIFVLGYSSDPSVVSVSAVYEIDVAKSNSPQGFYASVRRYVATPSAAAQLTAYYDVFYPAYDKTTWPTTTDNFAPVWVAFERVVRTDMTAAEAATIRRFQVARERPFYFIWWPDPNAQTLSMNRASNTSYPATDPRSVYNHMGGRTSFMFTVPMFPAL